MFLMNERERFLNFRTNFKKLALEREETWKRALENLVYKPGENREYESA